MQTTLTYDRKLEILIISVKFLQDIPTLIYLNILWFYTVYMYIVLFQGQITPEDNILIMRGSLHYLDLLQVSRKYLSALIYIDFFQDFTCVFYNSGQGQIKVGWKILNLTLFNPRAIQVHPVAKRQHKIDHPVGQKSACNRKLM